MIKNINIKNVFFYVMLIVTVLFIMKGSYLPMVDLPQHAAQVVALDDLLKSRSHWSGELETNFKTPYLIGYFSWLGIYQFFDILISSRILISLIFILFIYSFNLLRKELEATSLTTWIAIPSFFGFCYEWGFVTYLLAISVGLIFFTLNIRWVKYNKKLYGFLIFLVGTILFFSHILSFLFFCLLSFVYILFSLDSYKRILKYIPVYIGLFFYLIFYVFQVDSLSSHYNYGMDVKFHSIFTKIDNLINYPWSMTGNYYFFSAFLLLYPLFFGYRFSKNLKRYIPLLVFIFIWFTLPHFYNNTFFIYERYSILFFGFYYLVFDIRESFGYRNFGFIFLYIIVFSLLSEDYKSIIFAKKENQDFHKILEVMPSEKRVLGLMYENTSAAIGVPFTYVHFGSWYQAEKRGWSDFNFAWFHPQIVRYNAAIPPEVRPGFEWMPFAISSLNNCKYYDLLLIRAYDHSFNNAILESGCKDYKFIGQYGVWYVLSKN